MIYNFGWAGMNPNDPPSPEKSEKWYKASADQGHPGGLFEISHLHFERAKSKADSLAAEGIMLRSAEQGYPDAQTWLGIYYEKKNRVADAVRLYTKASQNCDELALLCLVSLPAKHPDLKIDCSSIFEHCQNAPTTFLSALLEAFESGNVFPKDPKMIEKLKSIVKSRIR